MKPQAAPRDLRLDVECYDCGQQAAHGVILVTERVLTPLGVRSWTLCRGCFAKAEADRVEQVEWEEAARKAREQRAAEAA